MNDDRWGDLVELIDEKYTVDHFDRRVEKLENNPELTQTIESIEFERDNVKYKIERITSPRIVDKKTHFHQRGVAARVEYVYDPEETQTKVMFFKQMTDGYWNEISPEDLMAGA